MPELVETSTQTPLQESQTPNVPTPTLEETSVSAHQSQFSPKESQRTQITETPIETERPRERHRAQSQQAGAEDAQEIATLTKQLRAKEAELAKIKPDALAGSPRVLTLKQRIRAIEADLADVQKAAPVEPPAPVAPARQTQPPAPVGTFAEPEPKLDQFTDAEDPYAAWQRATARWDRRKDEHEAHQAVAVQQQQQQTLAFQQAQQARMEAYQGRLQVFKATTPDFDQKLEAAVAEIGKEIPGVLYEAIVADDNGPQFLYSVISDPVFRDEMLLLSEGKALTESNVATVRRRLRSQLTRTQAAATGSAAAMTPTSWTSRPPNPVRTSPLTTGDDPPGDGHSLADHRKHYQPTRRR